MTILRIVFFACIFSGGFCAETHKTQCLLRLVKLYAKTGDTQRALDICRNALTFSPDNLEAQNQYLSIQEKIYPEKKVLQNNKKLILGMGSGRCGTTSLTVLLRAQEGCYAAHESLPLVQWRNGERRIAFHKKRFDQLLKRYRIVGEVGHFWLPYFDQIVEWYPDVRAVIMKREKQATVESFMKATRTLNHWIENDGRVNFFDDCFPKYPVKEKRQAIAMYWDDYYALAEKMAKKYPEKIRLYYMTDLNSERKQKEILTFLGFKNIKTLKKLHFNRAGVRDGQALY